MKDTTVIIRPRRKRACLMILTREVLSNSAASTEVQSDLRALLDEVPEIGECIGIDIIDALFRTTGHFCAELLLCARPARIEHLPELQDRQDDDTPDYCEEQRAERRMRGQEIAKMQHQVKREDVADTDDLRLRVIRAHHRLSFLQGGEQHLVGIGAA